ncbi:hypothetical protein Salat_1477800 [Sesamum alatum]|uniref:Uncharacterized protein n=1 Tax=Sesamum alatum TaxID=300844 RepID=A0AAE1YBA9_9LAMI|nr:hypothetical protein Salat_1477800 [Sesamum alatum]
MRECSPLTRDGWQWLIERGIEAQGSKGLSGKRRVPRMQAGAPCSRATPPAPTPIAGSLPRPRSPLLPTPPSQVRLGSPPSSSGIGRSSVAFDKDKAIVVHNSFQELVGSPDAVLDKDKAIVVHNSSSDVLDSRLLVSCSCFVIALF